ncbi:uncharacterized protein SPAPADRAFT_149957 [Spathaspora passalidarum NRRL Y-27907]|uniref:Uncharacterized protein n=1 Tax=Spathaspora passalidarum (strain NRRL Y-27907 / 11-Y1) TaxID=619300 RepID=G3AM63_SPAPN|nr:uncharacterized protein SPAPADRAFT_149957 [Spathaspora passalidarum NRRL Y-27907]EGW32768.1 hypothetical protein SPAPADRAFT_149957 [Spathaspora passalidarum NRRL Y-27907]
MSDAIGESENFLDSRNNALLTEHLGFRPITLIDEVINAANEIMYRGLPGFQEYLARCKVRALQDTIEDDIFAQVSDHEIKAGVAQLESLIASQIDINFDKYELYTLRNIFHIDPSLVNEGWIKLKHHEGIEFSKDSSKKKRKLDQELVKLNSEIQVELHIRKVLRLQLARLKKLIKLQRGLAENVAFLTIAKSDKDSEEVVKAKEILKSISPLDQTLMFLIKQTKRSIVELDQLATKVNLDMQTKRFKPDYNDKFIDGRAVRILDKTGVRSSDDSTLSLGEAEDATMDTTVDAQAEQEINFSIPSSPDLETVNQAVEATTKEEMEEK